MADADVDDGTATTEVQLGLEKEDTVPLPAYEGVLAPSLGRDDVMGVAIALMGPTDDIREALAPTADLDFNVPTVAGAEVIGFSITLAPYGQEGSNRFTGFNVTFISTATRADAALATQTELTAMGWEVDIKEETTGDIATSILNAKNPELPTEQLQSMTYEFTNRIEGGSIGEVTIIDRTRVAVEPAMVGEGWHGNSPIPNGGVLRDFIMQVSATDLGNYLISLWSTYAYQGQEAPDVFTDALAMVDASDFELAREPTDESFQLLYLDHPAKVTVSEVVRPPPTLTINQTIVVAAEPTATPGAAASSDPANDNEAASDSAGPTYATPNGPELMASMNREQIEQLMISLLGPTDDVAGTTARAGLFPAAIPALPVATIAGVYGDNTITQAPDDADFMTNSLTVDVLTTAKPDEAILAIQTALGADGYDVQTSENESLNDGRVLYRSTLKHPTTPSRTRVELSSQEEDGETTVTITFWDQGRPDFEAARVTDGWYGASGFVPDGTFYIGEFAVAYVDGIETAFVSLRTAFLYENTTQEELLAEGLAVAANGGDWALVEVVETEVQTIVKMTFEGADATAAMVIRDAPADKIEQALTYSRRVGL